MNYRSSKISILVGIMRLPNVTRSPKLLLYDVRSELCVCYAVLSHSVVSDTFVTPWTAACQAPLFMGILQARILEWLPCPPSGDLPNPGVEPRSRIAGGFFTIWALTETNKQTNEKWLLKPQALLWLTSVSAAGTRLLKPQALLWLTSVSAAGTIVPPPFYAIPTSFIPSHPPC